MSRPDKSRARFGCRADRPVWVRVGGRPTGMTVSELLERILTAPIIMRCPRDLPATTTSNGDRRAGMTELNRSTEDILRVDPDIDNRAADLFRQGWSTRTNATEVDR